MPRNSISRRVARAASIGGSRSYRQRTPLGWYSILLVVCIVGLGLIVYSRHERQVRATSASTTNTPRDKPLMIRLRRGKFSRNGGDESGNSLSTAPLVAI